MREGGASHPHFLLQEGEAGRAIPKEELTKIWQIRVGERGWGLASPLLVHVVDSSEAFHLGLLEEALVREPHRRISSMS